MKPILCSVVVSLLMSGGAVFAAPAVFIYPTGYSLLDGTAAKLVTPVDNGVLIPTAEGALINQTDAVYRPTTAPLLNPLAVALVPTGVPATAQ
jgi:hypothetical protein